MRVDDKWSEASAEVKGSGQVHCPSKVSEQQGVIDLFLLCTEDMRWV